MFIVNNPPALTTAVQPAAQNNGNIFKYHPAKHHQSKTHNFALLPAVMCR